MRKYKSENAEFFIGVFCLRRGFGSVEQKYENIHMRS
jgi:hypothetical protein